MGGGERMSLGTEARQHKGGSIVVFTAMAMLIVLNTVDRSQIQNTEATTVTVKMVTSWYGKELQGSRMANGKIFRAEDPTIAAHKGLPLGTEIILTNPENGRHCKVKTQDRGPFVAGRDLDISEAAAETLGMKDCGVKTLLAKIVK